MNKFTKEDWPFYWITQVTAHYEQALEKTLKSMNLDIPSWRVLMLLQGDKPRSVMHLAKHSITKQPTMTRIVYRMRDKGLVRLQPHQSDARVTEVVQTEEGAVARQAAWEAASNLAENALVDVNKKDQETIKSILVKIYDNFETFSE